MSKWFITDDDCLQCCNRISDGAVATYEFVQINSFAGHVDGKPFWQVAHANIDVRSYTEEEILSALASYGYDDKYDFILHTCPEGAEDKFNDPDYILNNQLIAEMLFEIDAVTEFAEEEFGSWDDAVHRISEITKLDLNKFKENSPAEPQISSEYQNMDVADLDLSPRSYRCLRRAGISLVGELISLTEKELMSIQNLGWRCRDEILAKLSELGLSLSPVSNNTLQIVKKPLSERLFDAERKRKEQADTQNAGPVVSVGHFADQEDVKHAVLQSDAIRSQALDICYHIPGYLHLSREDSNKLYDLVRKAVTISFSKEAPQTFRQEPDSR